MNKHTIKGFFEGMFWSLLTTGTIYAIGYVSYRAGQADIQIEAIQHGYADYPNRTFVWREL